MTQEELEFRRRCPYDAFGDYSDVLKEIRQKEKETRHNGKYAHHQCIFIY